MRRKKISFTLIQLMLMVTVFGALSAAGLTAYKNHTIWAALSSLVLGA